MNRSDISQYFLEDLEKVVAGYVLDQTKSLYLGGWEEDKEAAPESHAMMKQVVIMQNELKEFVERLEDDSE